jgi:hypothetical protein
MKLPRTSVEGFESPGRSLYGLRRAFRITDINSLLQALEWVPVRAEQSLEEANVVCRHDTPPVPQHTLKYGGQRDAGSIEACPRGRAARDRSDRCSTGALKRQRT